VWEIDLSWAACTMNIGSKSGLRENEQYILRATAYQTTVFSMDMKERRIQ
jgi:hypothetical protein